MHPILGHRTRVSAYLLAWAPLTLFLAALFVEVQKIRFDTALLLVVPPTAAFAFVCLAAWFPCRALPLRKDKLWSTILAHLISAEIASGVWLLTGILWAQVVAAWGVPLAEENAFVHSAFLMAALGFVLYLLSVSVHYLLTAQEDAAERERRLLELDVLANQAELKSLKAQVQPHFLFNSLNSISALTSEDPRAARGMCLKLAEFLRATLAAGRQAAVPLEKELELVHDYLEIEKVRFGDRLRFEERIDEAARAVALPPLLLQPIAENAVTHGISNLIDGGTIELTAQRKNGYLEIAMENPFDPESPRRPGEGLGLENVRRRLQALHEGAGRLEVREADGRFRVRLTFPVEAPA